MMRLPYPGAPPETAEPGEKFFWLPIDVAPLELQQKLGTAKPIKGTACQLVDSELVTGERVQWLLFERNGRVSHYLELPNMKQET